MSGEHHAPEACPVHKASEPEPPFIQHGQVTFQAHHVGWIVCGFFTIIAVSTSWWLIAKHLANYSNKGQQRYIVRCLFLVPIYAIISTLSYILYDSYASPLVLVRDAYEALVLHAFFNLLLEYIAHDPEEQKGVFRDLELKKWIWPMGWVKYRPSGLYFLQLMKWGVLQYAVLRPLCTAIALVLNLFSLYCESSWSPRWGHIHIVAIISLSVTVAMYCLIQLYFAITAHLKPHGPLLKFFSIKAVVFLTFWQATFLAVLAAFGVVKSTKYMTADEINIGFAAILETFEMMLFAFLHLKAFSYHPYLGEKGTMIKPSSKWGSFCHVFDFRDLFRQIGDGAVYMWLRMRGVEAEPSGRLEHLEKAMGRSRFRNPYEIRSADSIRVGHRPLARDGRLEAEHILIGPELQRLMNMEAVPGASGGTQEDRASHPGGSGGYPAETRRNKATPLWTRLYEKVSSDDRDVPRGPRPPMNTTSHLDRVPTHQRSRAPGPRTTSPQVNIDDEPPLTSLNTQFRKAQPAPLTTARMITPPPLSLLIPPNSDAPDNHATSSGYNVKDIDTPRDRDPRDQPSNLIRGDSVLNRIFNAGDVISEQDHSASPPGSPEHHPFSGPLIMSELTRSQYLQSSPARLSYDPLERSRFAADHRLPQNTRAPPLRSALRETTSQQGASSYGHADSVSPAAPLRLSARYSVNGPGPSRRPHPPSGLIMPLPLSPARFPASGPDFPTSSNTHTPWSTSEMKYSNNPRPIGGFVKSIQTDQSYWQNPPSSSLHGNLRPRPVTSGFSDTEAGFSSASEGPRHPALRDVPKSGSTSGHRPTNRQTSNRRSVVKSPVGGRLLSTSVVPVPVSSSLSKDEETGLSRLLRAGESRFPSNVTAPSAPAVSPPIDRNPIPEPDALGSDNPPVASGAEPIAPVRRSQEEGNKVDQPRNGRSRMLRKTRRVKQ